MTERLAIEEVLIRYTRAIDTWCQVTTAQDLDGHYGKADGAGAAQDAPAFHVI